LRAFPDGSVFLYTKRFLENLDFHGLATEQALQFPHSSLEFTHRPRAENAFIRVHRPQATPEHSPALSTRILLFASIG
jgi:hypothetical protein